MQNPNCGLSWLKCQRATGNSKKSNHKPTLVDISKLFSFTTVCTCSLDCKTVKKMKVPVGKKRSCQSFSCVQLFGTRGILQARILEWVAVPFSRGSSQPRDGTHTSYIFCTGRPTLYHWVTWETQNYGDGHTVPWTRVIETWALNGWIVSYVNYISIKCFLSCLCTDMQWSPRYKVLIIKKSKV